MVFGILISNAMKNIYKTLSEITVIEVGGLASAPYASHLLVEMGARVISLEPFNGKLARHYGPFPKDKPEIEQSALHTFLDTGKESITINFDDRSDQLWLAERLKSSDIFLTALDKSALMTPPCVSARVSGNCSGALSGEPMAHDVDDSALACIAEPNRPA